MIRCLERTVPSNVSRFRWYLPSPQTRVCPIFKQECIQLLFAVLVDGTATSFWQLLDQGVMKLHLGCLSWSGQHFVRPLEDDLTAQLVPSHPPGKIRDRECSWRLSKLSPKAQRGSVTTNLRFFCASKKWRLLAHLSRTSDLAESLAVRGAWQPGHLRWLLTWQCREPTTSRAGVALLHFCFQATRPDQGDHIPFFKVQFSSDSYRYRFFILVFGSARLNSEACFGDLVAERMGDWEKESAVWL